MKSIMLESYKYYNIVFKFPSLHVSYLRCIVAAMKLLIFYYGKNNVKPMHKIVNVCIIIAIQNHTYVIIIVCYKVAACRVYQ